MVIPIHFSSSWRRTSSSPSREGQRMADPTEEMNMALSSSTFKGAWIYEKNAPLVIGAVVLWNAAMFIAGRISKK